MPGRKPPGKRPAGKWIARPPKRERLTLRVSKGLEKLKEAQEMVIPEGDQAILRRIQEINSGARMGTLTEVDYNNLKRIAKINGIDLSR